MIQSKDSQALHLLSDREGKEGYQILQPGETTRRDFRFVRRRGTVLRKGEALARQGFIGEC